MTVFLAPRLNKILNIILFDQLKRWPKCRGLKQSGKREEIVQRVASCLQGPNHRVLDVSIDGGKWFAAKVLKENEELKGRETFNEQVAVPPLYQRKDGAVFHHKIYHRCSTMDIFITMLLSPSKLCSWTPPPPPPPKVVEAVDDRDEIDGLGHMTDKPLKTEESTLTQSLCMILWMIKPISTIFLEDMYGRR